MTDELKDALERREANVIYPREISDLAVIRAAIEERDKRIAELGEQLEYDRTALAEAITNVKKAMDSRYWLTEGRGSYEWDDDRFRGEFTEAYAEIKNAIDPLKKIAADWSGCPRKAEDVAASRINLKERIVELERRCLLNSLQAPPPTIDLFMKAEEADSLRGERDAARAEAHRLRVALEKQPCSCLRTSGLRMYGTATDYCSRCSALAPQTAPEDKP